MPNYPYKKAGNAFDRDFRNSYNDNLVDIAEDISRSYNGLKSHIKGQASHTSDQISHLDGLTVSDEIEKTKKRINNLILNADGTNIKEVVDLRVNNKGEVFDTANDRLFNTESRIDNLYGEQVKRDRKFEEYLNYQKIIFSVLARDNSLPFPQAISINQEDDELYIARQENGGSVCIISRYELSTSALKDSQQFTITSSTYNEGIPWFKNSEGELCFLVRQQFENELSIFNYTTGEIEETMEVLGSYKTGNDIDKKYFVSGNSTNERMDRIYIYDFQSIIAGSPRLLMEVSVNNQEIMFEKVQGITFHDNKIVLGQGKDYPAITVLNLDGSIAKSYSFSKESFADLIEQNYDFDRVNYAFENEGVCMFNYDGYVIPALMQIAVERSGRELVFVTLAGAQDGKLIETAPRPRPNITDITYDKVALHMPNRNFVTNGAFDVWQRGTSFTDDGVFTADRWLVNAVGTNESGINRTERVKKPMSAPFSNKYGLRITKLKNVSNMSRTDLIQRIENPTQFKSGEDYTLALWARTNKSSHRMKLHLDMTHDGKHDNLAIRSCQVTTRLTFFVLNIKMPDMSAYKFKEEDYVEVQIDVDTTNSSSYDSLAPGEWVEFYLVKLEKGRLATPYVARPLTEEIAECQRYYQIYSTNTVKQVDLRPTMRKAPTVTQRSDGNYGYDAELPETPTY
ncbi:hypothetical protein ACP2WB_05615 [Bacillus licheniformis]|nr:MULTISPECIES: hypothetical protein [Bacillus]TWL10911.1 hypothetical protein CHCC19466_0075 [Bacillus licheniformis]TWL94516.1 hypothetical protein CHCC15291_0054 [Bacillus licheniformis]TWM05847.1 hypothetical protein CHCC15289_1744 [Bacillus licheniformis]UVD84905.1 hypothetical protein NR984_05135 [Bacillus sp. BAC]GIN27938.1 hypothetical protein J31TS2_45180 [Bacillus licheniformis]